MITAEKLELSYPKSHGSLEVLRQVDLTVGAGEVVAVIGPSGCGKSSLLNVLAGLVRPTGGNVSVAGVLPEQAREQRLVSYVFQKPVLFDWRTVRQNVFLPIELMSDDGNRQKWNARTDELIQVMGLHDFRNYYPRQLSGGMKARAALARAYLTEPRLLLMDEPFASIDQITRDRMNLKLLEINKRYNSTVVFVTHSIEEAVFISRRVVLMSKLPGTVEKVLEIDLPEKRMLSLRDSNEFNSYTSVLRAKLEAAQNGYQ